MYCKNCGHEIDDKAVVCVHCGVATDNYCQNPAVQTETKVNGLALAGMILSIVGAIGGNYIFCIPSLIGLILSIIGLNKVKEYKSGKGFAIAGIIVGAVSLFFWALFWFLVIFGLVAESGGSGNYYAALQQIII